MMADTTPHRPGAEAGRRQVILHPLAVRLAHWTFALAVVLLIGSGWRIHNYSGFVGWLEVPIWMTIGGSFEGAQRVHGETGLAGALQWHYFAMWLMFASILFYVAWGVLSGHFRRRFLPIRLREAAANVRDFLAGRLDHDLGARNAVQKLLYLGAVLAMVVMIWSGMAIWKPTQFQTMAWLLGGYTGARYIHFLGMVALVGFIVVHLLLVVLVPRTLPPMITGRIDADALGHPAPGETQ